MNTSTNVFMSVASFDPALVQQETYGKIPDPSLFDYTGIGGTPPEQSRRLSVTQLGSSSHMFVMPSDSPTVPVRFLDSSDSPLVGVSRHLDVKNQLNQHSVSDGASPPVKRSRRLSVSIVQADNSSNNSSGMNSNNNIVSADSMFLTPQQHQFDIVSHVHQRRHVAYPQQQQVHLGCDFFPQQQQQQQQMLCSPASVAVVAVSDVSPFSPSASSMSDCDSEHDSVDEVMSSVSTEGMFDDSTASPHVHRHQGGCESDCESDEEEDEEEDDHSFVQKSQRKGRKAPKRVDRACGHCKRSKTRCDNQRPCARCVRTGKEDTCVDAVHKKRGRKRTRFPAPQQTSSLC